MSLCILNWFIVNTNGGNLIRTCRAFANKGAVRWETLGTRLHSQEQDHVWFCLTLLLWMLLEQHPLCHRMCKVTKETSWANKIMRNAIDLTSITFRWTSSNSRQSVFSTTLDGSQRSPRKWRPVAKCLFGQNWAEISQRWRQNFCYDEESNLGPVAGY